VVQRDGAAEPEPRRASSAEAYHHPVSSASLAAAAAAASASPASPASPGVGALSARGVRLTQNMQVGPCIRMGIQLNLVL
jgi:hypothetical protein